MFLSLGTSLFWHYPFPLSVALWTWTCTLILKDHKSASHTFTLHSPSQPHLSPLALKVLCRLDSLPEALIRGAPRRHLNFVRLDFGVPNSPPLSYLSLYLNIFCSPIPLHSLLSKQTPALIFPFCLFSHLTYQCKKKLAICWLIIRSFSIWTGCCFE